MTPTAPTAPPPEATAPTPAGWLRPSWLLACLQGALLVLAAWLIYQPALHGEWLWDDDVELVDNPVMDAPDGLQQIWFQPGGADYFPLKTTFQWMIWRIWPNQSAVFHQANFVLHLLSAFLLWRIFNRLGLGWAWLGALLFVIHPLMVESVAWISELKNTLSLPFLLLSFLAYLAWDQRRSAPGLAAAVLLFVAAMLCKSSVVMFPPVLLLYAWWKRGRLSVDDFIFTAPFFLVSLALGLVTYSFQMDRAIGDATMPHPAMAERLMNAGLITVFYLAQAFRVFLPLPIYPSWSVAVTPLWKWLPWPLLLALAWWAWRKRSTWGRHVLFGGGFFLLNLLPVMGFVTISFMLQSWVADHLAYLPALGLFGLAAAGAELGYRRCRSAGARAGLLAAVSAAGLALAWSSRTYARVFDRPLDLWTYGVQGNPASWVAHNDLARAYGLSDQPEKAVAELLESRRANPDYVVAANNLGLVLMRLQRFPEAIAVYEDFVRRHPEKTEIYNNLATAYVSVGRNSDAYNSFREDLRRRPDSAETLANLGFVLSLTGHPRESIAEYQIAIRLRPDFAEAQYKLGLLLYLTGQPDQAIPHLEAATHLDPTNTQAGQYLAMARRHDPPRMLP